MTGLKTENSFPNDHPSIMPHRTLGQVVEFDLTKSPALYRAEIKKICERFDVAEARAVVNEIVDEIAAERQQQEAQRQEQHARNQEIKNSQNQPLEIFARVFHSRNGNPELLYDFLTAQDVDSLRAIESEIQGKTRRYDSIFHHEIPAALQILKTEIASRATEPHSNLLTKVKEKLGAA